MERSDAVLVKLWVDRWWWGHAYDALSFPQEHLCCSAHLLAEMEAKSSKNSNGSVVMPLKRINMFSRVCSQRRSDVKYGVNQYSRVKTTLQNNHYNLGKAGKHITAITYLSLSAITHSLFLSSLLSQFITVVCDTQCTKAFNLLWSMF